MSHLPKILENKSNKDGIGEQPRSVNSAGDTAINKVAAPVQNESNVLNTICRQWLANDNLRQV